MTREFKFRIWDKYGKYMHMFGENHHDDFGVSEDNGLSTYDGIRYVDIAALWLE